MTSQKTYKMSGSCLEKTCCHLGKGNFTYWCSPWEILEYGGAYVIELCVIIIKNWTIIYFYCNYEWLFAKNSSIVMMKVCLGFYYLVSNAHESFPWKILK